MLYVWSRGEHHYRSFLQLLFMHKDVFAHLVSKINAVDFNDVTENDKRLCTLALLVYYYCSSICNCKKLLSESGVFEVFLSNPQSWIER